jgi:hypothetical protein
VLGAVKRAVDDEPRPGRYILTGRVRIDLDAQTWPGTGRLVRLPMQGLSVREIEGRASGELFLDRLLRASPEMLGPGGPADLADHLDLALRGGFPEPALRLEGIARQAWLDSYVDQLITRDAPTLAGSRDPDRLRRYLEALAINSAGIVEDKTLYDAARINQKNRRHLRTAAAESAHPRRGTGVGAQPTRTSHQDTQALPGRPVHHRRGPPPRPACAAAGRRPARTDDRHLRRSANSSRARRRRVTTPLAPPARQKRPPRDRPRHRIRRRSSSRW